ncbi:RHS repeat domain-containing protein, partial [Spartinivicinus poritis]|nr:hypothetical protein [Spartinivicinus sp. A2-2]
FKWGNGILLSRSYDQDYRITGHLATGIDRRHFSYDDNSNITGIDRGVNSQTFAYDALDRLEGETGSYGSKTYVYDELGNRLSRSWKLGDKTETQTLTYKNNSNQLDKIENKAVVHTESGHFKKYDGDVYQYDPTGRLERVVNGGRLKVYNYYDSFGRRIRRVDGSLYQDFYTYSNGGNLLSELSYFERDLKQTSEYIWLGSMPIAHIAGKDGKYTISFIHTDHLNTPRYATNDQKKVVWQWESDAFGVGDAEEDVDGDGIKTAISLRFPGQVYDKETGTYYNVNRDYNPRLGRYVQTDPIGLNGGMNTYAYALQNPNRYTDPEGLLAPQAAGFIIGSISGGVGGFMAGMASGQSGWDLVGSVAGGAVAGGFVGAVTLNAAAAGSAGGALVSGSIARTAITTSVSGMASNVLGQYAGINISRVGKGMSLLTPQAAFRCKEFSGAQVLLSGIPGPFAAMNPLGIASRYQTGGIVRSNAASIAATGTQLGILGGLRNSTQLLTELVAEGPANGIDEQSCLCVPTEKAKE